MTLQEQYQVDLQVIEQSRAAARAERQSWLWWVGWIVAVVLVGVLQIQNDLDVVGLVIVGALIYGGVVMVLTRGWEWVTGRNK